MLMLGRLLSSPIRYRSVSGVLATSVIQRSKSSSRAVTITADDDSSTPSRLRHKKNALREICKSLKENVMFRKAALDLGIEDSVYQSVLNSFCSVVGSPTRLRSNPKLSDIIDAIQSGESTIDQLFPHFLDHTQQQHPLMLVMKRLKSVSDLTNPRNLYPRTLYMKRKFVLHLGPTNSGKTHHAHQEFLAARKAVYCSPLRMLAAEIYKKTNSMGVACDLITGEERQYGSGSEDNKANHLACTVEMVSTDSRVPYDVAVIDEIQMISDNERGGAWTRAVLGVPAHTIHVCGDPIALPLMKKLIESVDGEIEVKMYERLNPLVLSNNSFNGQYSNIKPGDCVVAFSRKKIFMIKRQIEVLAKQPCAVIYGSLPPATRNEQAELFNSSKVKVMVASDAIGMGVNLNIKRLIFDSLIKFDGESSKYLSATQVKQIGGRAGRYGQDHSKGEITTLHSRDLPPLHRLYKSPPQHIQKAGLIPTFDQILMYSSYLPDYPLFKLLTLFQDTATVSDCFFLCRRALKQQIFLSKLIANYNLALKDSYTLSLAPVSIKITAITEAYQKMVELFSQGEVITLKHLHALINWPIPRPRNSLQMMVLEDAHEIIDVYLWISIRYPVVFHQYEEAKALQEEIEQMIGHSLTSARKKPSTQGMFQNKKHHQNKHTKYTHKVSK